MQPQQHSPSSATYANEISDLNDSHTSGVSWGAVFAGATAAAALSLILLMLGLGLGLSSISPWSYSASTIGKSTIAWIIFIQLAASGAGGYLSGRLRIKWATVHTDEVYFRDTAHGLLAWAVASLIMVTLLAGGTKAILSGAIDAGTGAAIAAAPAIADAATNAKPSATDANNHALNYFSDMLLRAEQTVANANNSDVHNEINAIFVSNLRAGSLDPQDRHYLAGLIVKRTGMTQSDADHRVDEVYARLSKSIADAKETAKQAADQARKTAAHSALWMFIALLFGAFIASLAATLGGRQRDDMGGVSAQIFR